MKIKVKVFANLRENREKEQDIEVEEGVKALDIIHRLAIDPRDVAIIMINGRRVEEDSLLEQGDVLALFPPVGGG